MIDEITAIEYVESMSLRYDIEVQDNNNFFANGILVHNCQNLGTEIFAYENQIVETNIDPAVLEADALASGRLQVIDGKVFSIREAKASPDDLYEITLKLDGSSMTGFVRAQFNEAVIDEDGEHQDPARVGVCSRNLELKINEDNKDNTFVKVATETGLLDALMAFYKSTGREIAVQGEILGDGVQGNKEQIHGHEFFVFDIYDIQARRYLNPMERIEVFELLKEIASKIKHVPVLHSDVKLRELNLKSVHELLKFAEGPSLKAAQREGVVFKRLDGQFSFKAISNAWLLKSGD